MVDPDEHEIAAIASASPMAGKYLESIGKTDLAVLTEAEWLTLLEVVINAILGFPGWAVLGVPGAFIAWLGRSKRSRVFVKQSQL